MSVDVRWSDMDAFGHVNNARFLTLFEEARTSLIKHGGAGLAGLLAGCVVVRHEIDYLRPVTYGSGPVRIETWVSEVGRAGFRVAYEMFGPDGQLASRAMTRLAPITVADGRPRRLSEPERSALLSWCET
jgi:acyl-CoA thioester hydrolase